MKFDSLHFCSFNPNEDPKRRMAVHNHLKKLRKEWAIRLSKEIMKGNMDQPFINPITGQ